MSYETALNVFIIFSIPVFYSGCGAADVDETAGKLEQADLDMVFSPCRWSYNE